MRRIRREESQQLQLPANFALVVLAVVFQLFLSYSGTLQYFYHGHTISIFATLAKTPEMRNIPVFYNVYVANQSQNGRVRDLVMDQLSHLKGYHHPIYVHTIGFPLSIPNTTLLQHHTNASERVTLHSLWEYCQTHPNDKVVYLHSKGSYHPSSDNDRLRQLLTMGALSDECATNTDSTVSNLCGFRVSPYPHPHVPGNMWLAHCSYVNNLLEPFVFHDEMETVQEKLVGREYSHTACIGTGRFSAEHWILSHPSVKPSDLYTNLNYTWGYHRLGEQYQEGDFEWNLAPRHELDHRPNGCKSDLMHRLKEFRLLYNVTPGEEWWGWNFWLGPAKTPRM
jgi:hypothetical protein